MTGLRARTIKSLEEAQELKDDWEAIREEIDSAPFLSHMMSMIWLENLGEKGQPHLIVVERGRDVMAIFPLVLHRYKAKGLTLRTLTFIGTGAKMPLNYYHMQPLARQEGKELIDLVVKEIKKAPWDNLHFDYAVKTPIMNALVEVFAPQASGGLWTTLCYRINFTKSKGELEIPGRLGKDLMKVKHSLEKEGRLKIVAITDQDRARESLDQYVNQHLTRWSKREESMFLKSANVHFLKEVVERGLSSGICWMFEARIDDEIAAHHILLAEKGVAFGYRIGINEVFARYSPGHLVTLHSIDHAKERDFLGIDLGPGDEIYKTRLGQQDHELINVNAFRGWISFMGAIADLPVIRGLERRMKLREGVLDQINLH